MPKYIVPVTYSQTKAITVFARDAPAAIEKAVEIVEGWTGVLAAEADEAEAADNPDTGRDRLF